MRERPDARKPPKPRRKNTRTITEVAKRALKATPDQVRTFIPTPDCFAIAEAMLAGAHTFKSMAETASLSLERVRKVMTDCVACAWVSHAVRELATQRLGLIDAAMMNRAIAGDTKAAQLMYKRLADMSDKKLNVHVHGHVSDFDPSKLSDADLDRVMEAEFKEVRPHGQPTEPSDGAGKNPKATGRDEADSVDRRYE